MQIHDLTYQLYICDWTNSHTSPEERLESIRRYYAKNNDENYETWLSKNGYITSKTTNSSMLSAISL